jgi:hypothetical protein
MAYYQRNNRDYFVVQSMAMEGKHREGEEESKTRNTF